MAGFQAIQPLLKFLPIPQMRPHQHLPELAVVRHREMQQFMDDHIITELRVHAEQFIVEAQSARGGA